MRAIILAAGRGTRLRPLADNLPKCLAVKLGGKSLLERQIEAYRRAGIDDIVVVRGYLAEKIELPDIRYRLNKRFEHNNIMESLFAARADLEGDVIVSYGDLWFDDEIIRRTAAAPGDIVLTVQVDWRRFHADQKNHPAEAMEHVRWNEKKEVVEVGKIARDIGDESRLHAEFTGILKLSGRGCGILKEEYDRARSLFQGRPFQRAADFEKAYLCDLLNEMARRGIRIQVTEIDGGWLEFDTAEDVEGARRLFGNRP